MIALIGSKKKLKVSSDEHGHVRPLRNRNKDKKETTKKAQDLSGEEVLTSQFTRLCCINLQRREDRWDGFCTRVRSSLGEVVLNKIERFGAVDGIDILSPKSNPKENLNDDDDEMPSLEWDATKNAKYDWHIKPPMKKLLTPSEIGCAISHVRLWKQLVSSTEPESTMLILEDDAVFYEGIVIKQTPRRVVGKRKANQVQDTTQGFLEALSSVWKVVPSDWDILYLGFSDRGERTYVQQKEKQKLPIQVEVFQPTYGFQAHAYALRKSAASVLLSKLPVTGPVDVWLADNEWFGLKVYCGVVANEGWCGEGACLVEQRKHITGSDIMQSGRNTCLPRKLAGGKFK